MRVFTSLILGLALCTQSVFSQGEDRPLWEQEAMLLYSHSSSEFTRLRSLGRHNPRLADYTRALEILYGEGEATREQYQLAQHMFRKLVELRNDDAIGLASQYYLARIMQSHPMEQDLQTAKVLYFDLFDKFPDRFFGQMAFLKFATIEIYDDSVEGKTDLQRIQSLERYVSAITLVDVKRSYHRVMGEAYVSFGLDPESAFSHLNAAYDIGLPVESMRIDVLVKIAELGEILEKPERALMAYDEILLLAPRHTRREEFALKARVLRNSLASE